MLAQNDHDGAIVMPRSKKLYLLCWNILHFFFLHFLVSHISQMGTTPLHSHPRHFLRPTHFQTPPNCSIPCSATPAPPTTHVEHSPFALSSCWFHA